ncbi:hypothetical protein QO206_05735 [Leeuwenhoekiella aequorea]|uniref:hypothetical protein n=1 Tax=Leeuwenhoekiella aequorea TaxID=283736 RepID=UPI00352DF327|tara:strand:- start:13055 stop:13591 length:537 start_codon:yes stop_codon:yes gene_type:complete
MESPNQEIIRLQTKFDVTISLLKRVESTNQNIQNSFQSFSPKIISALLHEMKTLNSSIKSCEESNRSLIQNLKIFNSEYENASAQLSNSVRTIEHFAAKTKNFNINKIATNNFLKICTYVLIIILSLPLATYAIKEIWGTEGDSEKTLKYLYYKNDSEAKTFLEETWKKVNSTDFPFK